MRNSYSSSLQAVVIIGLVVLLISFVPVQQQTEWKAPKEADALKNPLKDNEKATLAGEELFTSMCVICHGKKGKGDGMASINIKPRPTNLTDAKVQQQTDGAIYWKITEGRAPMASYKTALEEQQRWQLVNYIRNLKK
jgi:mono/diheme cytochrome c family protein